MEIDLKSKLEKVGEKYFDLLLKRIEMADKTNVGASELVEIAQAIQMTACVVTTIEKIDLIRRDDSNVSLQN